MKDTSGFNEFCMSGPGRGPKTKMLLLEEDFQSIFNL